MKNPSNSPFYDAGYPIHEQLPRAFQARFEEQNIDGKIYVSVSINGIQIGDVLTDNSYTDDGYRYHDIFHLSYLAILGWSSCMRKILGRKRKSVSQVDEVEDGARATSIEEGISAYIFNYAEKFNFFENHHSIDNSFLESVKLACSKLEVKDKSCIEWQQAILQGYNIFRILKQNRGGTVKVDMNQKILTYLGKHEFHY